MKIHDQRSTRNQSSSLEDAKVCPEQFLECHKLTVSYGTGFPVLRKEKAQREKAKFVKYSQRFTYDLGLLAAVERAGGFDHLFQQIHDYPYHIRHSTRTNDTAEEPDSKSPVPTTSAHRDGWHRTSGTEAWHRRSETIRDSRPFSLQTAPRGAITDETTRPHSPPHSPPALAASVSDRVHPIQSSNLGTAAEWSFIEPPLRLPLFGGPQAAGARVEDTHETHNWLAPAPGSVPQSPYFPVLTRRWMGSAVGREGDAMWSHDRYPSNVEDGVAKKDIRGLGLAHEAGEYGRE
jgi:hypothetical protein